VSIGSKASKLLAAVRRDWGRMGPTDLWHMAEFANPDPISYLSELLSTQINRFDLAEKMSKAINSIAGEEMSDISGAKIIVPQERTHDVVRMFTNEEGSGEAERLRDTIEDSARIVVAENYGEMESKTPPPQEELPQQVSQRTESSAPVVVDRDPELWAAHMGEDVDESVAAAFIRSGKVLILDSSGKARLFVNEADAEEEFGPLKELSENSPATKPAPPPVDERPGSGDINPSRGDSVDKSPPSHKSPGLAVPAEIRSKAIEAKRLTGILMSIRKSLEAVTGFDGMSPGDVQAAYTELTKISGSGATPRPTPREYDFGRDDPAMSRLLSLLHDLLERQGELDDAGVNVYSLIFLQEGLYEFLERHAKAASCDVLRRRPNRGMPKDGKNPSGPKGIALNVLKKEAIQLSKGNIRATKDGTITIDPGLMNCPVVREVMRQLETKASDMKSVRDRLDDLGMLVTQGEHGQVQVYCLVRSESNGGARTKMCQWFIDAHGNDGKFKIECAKD